MKSLLPNFKRTFLIVGYTFMLLPISLFTKGLMASTVIICHNHPSGNLDPSEQDKRITTRLKEGLALFDINLVDHLIVGPDGERLSFLEQGLI